jgi:monothiol glutaredoxin
MPLAFSAPFALRAAGAASGAVRGARPARTARAARPRVRASLGDLLTSGGVPVGAASGIEDLPLEPVPPAGIELPAHWARPGVYGVYGADGVLRYVAAVRDVRDAVEVHRTVIADEARCSAVRMMTVEAVDDAPLGDLAYNWLVAHTQEGPGAPEGNLMESGEEWRVEVAAEERGGEAVCFRKESGAEAEDVEAEIKRLLRAHKVLLFMKGTRTAPRCGFSEATVRLLTRRVGAAGFECVDCLDELGNRGLRDGIKAYSQWPTIPQLYVNGDFVGGADIVADMDSSGELAKELAKAGVPSVAV